MQHSNIYVGENKYYFDYAAWIDFSCSKINSPWHTVDQLTKLNIE